MPEDIQEMNDIENSGNPTRCQGPQHPRPPASALAYTPSDSLNNSAPPQSTVVGKMAELTVTMALIARGCQVFTPVMEGGEIDLIALAPTGKFGRIQVKTAQWASRARGFKKYLSMDLRRKLRNGPRRYTGIDLYAAVKDGQIWVIPASTVTGNRRVWLGTESGRLEAWEAMGL